MALGGGVGSAGIEGRQIGGAWRGGRAERRRGGRFGSGLGRFPILPASHPSEGFWAEAVAQAVVGGGEEEGCFGDDERR